MQLNRKLNDEELWGKCEGNEKITNDDLGIPTSRPDGSVKLQEGLSMILNIFKRKKSIDQDIKTDKSKICGLRYFDKELWDTGKIDDYYDTFCKNCSYMSPICLYDGAVDEVKVTTNEAIERFKWHYKYLSDTRWKKIYEIAIEALEKQVEKQIDFDGENDICPRCKSDLSIEKGNYCSTCGQAITTVSQG